MRARTSPPLVAQVIYRLDYGGLENGVVNLVNRMPANRYRQALVCLAGFGREFRNRIRRDDVEIVSIDKRPGKDPAAYLRMWRTLRRLRPAIVHTRNLGTVDMQWVAAAAGVPRRVHGEHGWEAADPRGMNPRSLRIRRACRPAVHRYVPMSRDLADWLQKAVHVPATRIRQAYSGVDTERFRPAKTAEAAARTAGVVRIGTVGRLDPVKNHAMLLQSLRAILDTRSDLRPTLRLTIVGDGPQRSSLESLARELNLDASVDFTGTRDDTAELMRTFDLFVLPSMNEGISNTILEAMASGLPVLAARVGGNPELVLPGVTGMLYDPADGDGLTAGLRRYLDEPALRESHGRAGRERVLAQFSLDSMIQRYLDIYDELTCAA
jgi:sugar transferase (PEP-CTERM/EpsH1 system associated)